MGYVFKLEALRRFRLHQEEIKQKALSEAQRKHGQALDKLNEHLTMRKNTELEFQQQQSSQITAPRAAMYRWYLSRLTQQIKECQDMVDQRQRQLDAAREDLLEAMKQRKVIDRLKENQLHAYLKQIGHEEMKFIDEMAINRHGLNQP